MMTINMLFFLFISLTEKKTMSHGPSINSYVDNGHKAATALVFLCEY